MNLHEINISDLQAEEVINEVIPNADIKKKVQKFTHRLKDIIEEIPESTDQPLSEWISNLKNEGISYVYPHGLNERDLEKIIPKMRVRYVKPVGILMVGSYLLDLSVGNEKSRGVDMFVPVPESIFMEKDYKNYKYYLKRNLYVCRIASALNMKRDDLGIDLMFHINPDFHRILIRIFTKSNSDASDIKFHYNIHFGTLKPPFPPRKLSPEKCNVRNLGDTSNPKPTPHYNASILFDSAYTTHLEFLASLIESNRSITGAIILFKVWFYQRFSKYNSNNLNGFIITMLLAYLAYVSPLSEYAKNDAISAFQTFRATLKYISELDIIEKKVVLFDVSKSYKKTKFSLNLDIEAFAKHYEVVMTDITGSFNLCSSVMMADILDLKHRARLGLECIQKYPGIESFRRLLLEKETCPGLEYDLSLICDCPSILNISECIRTMQCVSQSKYESLCNYACNMLTDALGDRIRLVVVKLGRKLTWDMSLPFSEEMFLPHLISFNFVIDYSECTKHILKGPQLGEKEKVNKLRRWWGDKLQVGRFNDGSTLHCIIFDSDDKLKDKLSVTIEMIEYLIKRNIGITNVHDIKGETLNTVNGLLLPKGCQLIAHSFVPLHEAVREFTRVLCSLDTLPLRVKDVIPVSASLRHTSVFIPQPILPPDVCISTSGYARRYQDPNLVLIEFQGSVMWPDDINAIRMTKQALYLKLAEEYSKKVPGVLSRTSVSCSDSDIFEDYVEFILPERYSIKCYTFIPKEKALILKSINNPEISDIQKTILVNNMNVYDNYNRKQPFYSSRIRSLCTRFPILSQTIRFVKRWISAHMLSTQISEETIELICLNSFVNSAPLSPPQSIFTAFVRVVDFLARWDYDNEPMIIELQDGSLSESDIELIHKTFRDEKDRRRQHFGATNSGPTMWIFHEENTCGSWWMSSSPSPIIAERLKTIAKASFSRCTEVYEKGLSAIDVLSEIFTTPYDYYDALVITNPQFTSRYVESLNYSKKPIANMFPRHKNLPRTPSQDEMSMCSIDTLQCYLETIKKSLGNACSLFADIYGGCVIGIKWDTVHCSQVKFSTSIDFNMEPCTLTSSKSLKIRKRSTPNDENTKIRPNYNGMLSEIALLGNWIVKAVCINSTKEKQKC